MRNLYDEINLTDERKMKITKIVINSDAVKEIAKSVYSQSIGLLDTDKATAIGGFIVQLNTFVNFVRDNEVGVRYGKFAWEEQSNGMFISKKEKHLRLRYSELNESIEELQSLGINIEEEIEKYLQF